MTHQEAVKWVNDNLDVKPAQVLQMFVDFLFDNGFTFDGEGFDYLGLGIGLIHIYNKNDWWIYSGDEHFVHEKFPLCDEMNIFMQNNAKINSWCSAGCDGCKTPAFFGKTFYKTCGNCNLAFGWLNLTERELTGSTSNFNVERMEKALKAMSVCKQIIDYKIGEEANPKTKIIEESVTTTSTTQPPYPPSVSQFEVFCLKGESTISEARERANLARLYGARAITINSVSGRSNNITSGNMDAEDDSTRWSARMDDGLLDNAEADWPNTKNIWFGADLGAVTTINSVIVTETAAIGFGADIRRSIGDWVVEVASDIDNPNENRTLSADGWTVVASGSGVGQGQAKLISFADTQARFVRMRTVSTK